MNRAIQIVKENPWKITFGTIITICITIGSFYFTDKRYVKRSEYEALSTQTTQSISKLQEELNKIKNK